VRPSPDNDGRRDFDFLYGAWRVHNRRLVHRLENCPEWEKFETLLLTRPILGGLGNRPILGGLGNVDTFRSDAAPDRPWEGFTLRLFDPANRNWSIWWASTNRPGLLDPPVAGRFAGGRGRFIGRDVHNGRPVQVRFDWTGMTSTSARWEQAFSPDEGQSWETNWVMTLRRLS
jgi:hypothetical protein